MRDKPTRGLSIRSPRQSSASPATLMCFYSLGGNWSTCRKVTHAQGTPGSTGSCSCVPGNDPDQLRTAGMSVALPPSVTALHSVCPSPFPSSTSSYTVRRCSSSQNPHFSYSSCLPPHLFLPLHIPTSQRNSNSNTTG